MYILDFLSDFPGMTRSDDVVGFEYRMLCSGELYNARVFTSDRCKSSVARILCDSPFTLVVCSYPFDEFPQELALQFSAPLVEEVHGRSTGLFHPDDDIARDVAALLTLFCRRLITVAAKIREQHAPNQEDSPTLFTDWPVGFIRSLNPVHWTSKPSVVACKPDGISIANYNPPPLGLNPSQLKRWLTFLPKSAFGQAVVLSARLYSLALQQLEHDVDVAYHLLIAAGECMANETQRDFTPTRGHMVSTKRPVEVLAMQYGLTKEQASQLAIEACKGMSWTNRKFIKFITDNTPEHFWAEDDLFRVPCEFLPSRDRFEDALGQVYSCRGKLLHEGRPFPQSAKIGMGPMVPFRVVMEAFSSKSFPPCPPIVWFERVINLAINSLIERSLPKEIS